MAMYSAYENLTVASLYLCWPVDHFQLSYEGYTTMPDDWIFQIAAATD